jgi:hypothetical protein
LVPLSDFGAQGAAIHYKAWVCTNPQCGYNLKMRGGEVHRNEPVVDLHGGARSTIRRPGSVPNETTGPRAI